MKVAIAALLLVSGCWPWPDVHDFPLGPPMEKVPPTGTPPLPLIIVGNVCVLVSPMAPLQCNNVGAGGLVVSLGGTQVVTESDGTFRIATPVNTSNLAFTVIGANIQPMTMGFGTSRTLPVLPTTLYNQMMSSIPFVPPTAGNGGILLFASQAGEPLSGVTAVATPAGAGAFYATSPSSFNTVSTSAAGTAFFPGQLPGPTGVALTDLTDNSEQSVDGIQVLDGGVTMVNTVFP